MADEIAKLDAASLIPLVPRGKPLQVHLSTTTVHDMTQTAANAAVEVARYTYAEPAKHAAQAAVAAEAGRTVRHFASVVGALAAMVVVTIVMPSAAQPYFGALTAVMAGVFGLRRRENPPT